MNASPSFYLFYFAAIASSGYFFYLGRRLSLPRRVVAASHGLIATVSLPLVIALRVWNPRSDPELLVAFMFLLATLSIASIIYSIVAVRDDWRAHVLHLPTLIVLIVSLTVAAFALLGT